MKIGDKVRSTKVRPKDVATVTKTHFESKSKVSDERVKKELRTSYEAEYDDGSKLIFYGFNINQIIFKVEEDDGQIHLNQFMNMEE